MQSILVAYATSSRSKNGEPAVLQDDLAPRTLKSILKQAGSRPRVRSDTCTAV